MAKTIDAAQVKALRDETGLPMMECKRALVEAGGDKAKAKEVLRKKGLQAAEGKAARAAVVGAVGSNGHFNGRGGVLVELRCESDFVAMGEDFKNLLNSIAMHIAMAAPTCVSREGLPAELVEKEKDILLSQPRYQKIPPDKRERALEGALGKGFYGKHVLLDQSYIRDEKMTVGDLIKAIVAKTGENIQVARFARFELGEE